MSNNNLFRIAGYAAIVSPFLWIAALGSGAANPAFTGPMLAVASIVFLVPVYALYVVHRAESSGLALGAALLTAAGYDRNALCGRSGCACQRDVLRYLFYRFRSWDCSFRLARIQERQDAARSCDCRTHCRGTLVGPGFAYLGGAGIA